MENKNMGQIEWANAPKSTCGHCFHCSCRCGGEWGSEEGRFKVRVVINSEIAPHVWIC